MKQLPDIMRSTFGSIALLAFSFIGIGVAAAGNVVDGTTLRGTLKIESSSPSLDGTCDEISSFSLTFNQRMKLGKPNTWVSSNVYNPGHYDNSSYLIKERPEGAYYWVPSIDENDSRIVHFTLRGNTEYAVEGDAKNATMAGSYQIYGSSQIQSAESTYKMSISDEMEFNVTGNLFGTYGGDEPDTTPFDITFNISGHNISSWPSDFALTGFPSTPNATDAYVTVIEKSGITFNMPVTVGSYGVTKTVKLPASDVAGMNQAGTYTISFPEGFFTCGNRKSNAMEATFIYGDGIYVKPVDDDDTNSFALTNFSPGVGNVVNAVENNGEYTWPLVKLGDFPGYPTGGEYLEVTDDDGNIHEVEINYSWYGMFDSCVLLKFNTCATAQKSGTYTIDIPRGFFKANGLPNRALSYIYTFENPDQPDVPEPEGDFKVKSFTLIQADGKNIDLTAPGATIGSMSGIGKEDTFILDTSMNDKIGYVELAITTMGIDEETGNEMELNYISKTSTAKNSDGARVIYAFSGTEDFNPGQIYWINVNCYNAEYPAGYPATPRTLIGKARYEFVGSAVPYEYSPYKLVTISPEPELEITEADTSIIMTFDGPVNIVGAKGDDAQTYIAEGPGSKHLFESVTSNADKSVWTLVPGAQYLKKQKSGIRVVVKAIDDNGKVVEGNSAVKEASAFGYTYICQIGVPDVILTPAHGETVSSLHEFTAQVANTPIALGSALDKPRLYDSGGNEVAEVDHSTEVMYDAGGNVLAGDNINDTKAMSISFRLDKEITTPGEYTLKCPFAAFALGTETSGYSSKNKNYSYVVKDIASEVENIESCVKHRIYGEGGMLVVEGLSNADFVKVYDLAGVILYSEKATSEIIRIEVEAGIYIVVINDRPFKVKI